MGIRHKEILLRHSRYLVWGIVLLIVVLTAVLRIRLLEVPLERDEGEYAYAGQLILQGIPPYAQAYNMKMPGIYAVYALIMAIFGQTPKGIHLGLLAVNISTIILMFLLGKKLYDSFVGIIAAASFAILSLDPSVLGVFANAEHFVILPVIGGLLLLLRGIESNRMKDFFWSGLLFGIAFIIKQHAIVFIIFAILYFCFNLFNRKTDTLFNRALRCGLFLSAILLPFTLTVLVLLLSGVFDKFWFWTFTYAREYVLSNTLRWGFFKKRIIDTVSLSILIWGLAAVGLLAPIWNRKIRPQSLFVAPFFVFSFFSVCLGFYFRPHYFIFLLPSVSLLAGIGISSVGCLFSRKTLLLRRGVPILLAIFIFSYTVYQQRLFLFRVDPMLASRLVYGLNPFPESLKIADYIKKHSKGGDRIAVIGSEPQIYFYSDRHSATGYIYTYALMEEHDFALKMQREMIKEIEEVSPKFIIFVNVHTSWLVRPYSNKLIFDWYEQYAKKYYDRVGIVDIIWPKSTIYYWGKEFAGYEPISKYWVSVYKKKEEGPEEGQLEDVEDPLEKSRILNKMGKIQGKAGNLDQAISSFEEAIQLDPNYAESYNDLGYAYYLKGDYERAEEYFKKALEVDPDYEIARRNLETLRSTGDRSPKADEI